MSTSNQALTAENEYAPVPTANTNTKPPATFVPFPFSLLGHSVCFHAGYKMERIDRSSVRVARANVSNYYIEKTEGWALGVTIGQLPCLPHVLNNIVRPSIKVHAVNVDTGRYIRSTKRAAVLPLRTREITLKDLSITPAWNEELVLDANFADMINEDTLLLFEIFDDRPSLTTRKSIGTKRPPKNIAWGFLMPIGSRGQLNCGIKKEWDPQIPSTESSENSAIRVNEKKPNRNNKTIEKPKRWRDQVKQNLKKEQISEGKSNDENIEEKEKEKDDSELAKSDEEIDDRIENDPVIVDGSGRECDIWLRLQLFEYVENDGLLGFIQRKIMGWPSLKRSHSSVTASEDLTDDLAYPDGIPPVYLQWRRQKHHLVKNGWLSVALGPRRIELAIGNTSSATSQQQQALQDIRPRVNILGDDASTKDGQTKTRAAVLKRLRAPHEPCVVPDRVLHRIHVGPEGASFVQFSYSGHLLAVASKASDVPLFVMGSSNSVTNPSSVFALKLYDTDTNEEVWTNIAAHHGMIYSIVWSKDDHYLVTASADGTAKVWDVATFLFPRKSSKPSKDEFSLKYKPKCANILTCVPPCPVYCAIFQEMLASGRKSTQQTSFEFKGQTLKDRRPPPKVITGSLDGHLRVFDNGHLVGYISLSGRPNGNDNRENTSTLSSIPDPAHAGRVQSITIDDRSKYLISGDSTGEILIWRTDNTGWYQLLRKLRKDVVAPNSHLTASSEYNSLIASGTMTLQMHPEKSKAQLLMFQHNPSQLKVYNMSNYRPESVCTGFTPSLTGRTVFQRASLSADGRYVVCGTAVRASRGGDSVVLGSSFEGKEKIYYRISVWDSQTGSVIKSALSEYKYSFPIRSISWHPKQHMMAISTIGQGSSVVIYSGSKDSAENASLKINSSIIAGFGKSVDVNESVGNPMNQMSPTAGLGKVRSRGFESLDKPPSEATERKSAEQLQKEKARGILEKIKAARQSINAT